MDDVGGQQDGHGKPGEGKHVRTIHIERDGKGVINTGWVQALDKGLNLRAYSTTDPVVARATIPPRRESPPTVVGAAARLIHQGDLVIIISYCTVTDATPVPTHASIAGDDGALDLGTQRTVVRDRVT